MTTTISQSDYKGTPSFVLESNRLRAEFVVQGARMVSLVDKQLDHEFLVAQTGESYLHSRFGYPMTPDHAAGYDDMFPTIDVCHYEEFPWEGVQLPDHGEVWALDWDMVAEESALTASVHGVRLPYRLSRRMSLPEESHLRMDYLLENLSPLNLSYIWSAHPMLLVEEGSQFEIPEECERARPILSLSGRLGSYGDEFTWPVWTDRHGNTHDLSLIRSPQVGDVEKYFFTNRLKEGWCRLRHPSNGATLNLKWPVEQLPYFAVVVDEAGSGPRFYCLLEPCSAPFDRVDFSRKYTSESFVAAKSSRSWHLTWGMGC